MRFCPFCAQENTDDARECGHCGKRLPAPRAAPPRPASGAPPVASRPSPPERPKPPPRPAPRSKPLRPEPGPAPHAPVSTGRLTDDAQTLKPPPLSPPMPAAPVPSAPPPAAPAKAVHSDAQTLVPPLQRKPSRTLLGVPALDPATGELTMPTAQPRLKDENSERRETKPLGVKTAAEAIKSNSASQRMPALRSPTPPPPDLDDEDEATTVENPKIPMVDSAPLVISDQSASVVTPLPPPPAGGDRQRKPSLRPMSVAEPVTALTATPAMPTIAVPPMPPHPRGENLWKSLWGSVAYLPPLVKAVLARRKAQKSLRELLHGDQKLLDQVLRELGRAARENEVEAPAIADEMRRVRAEEDRRRNAELKIHDLDDKSLEETSRWDADEAERKSDLESRESQIRGHEEELKKLQAERKMHESVRDKIDGLIRAAEKRAASAEARAVKAESTPPEKGGGPNTAANARAEASAARSEATSHIPGRDEAREKIEALDGPMQTLTKQIADGKTAVTLKKKELAEALTAHKKALADLEAEKKRCQTERDGAEREMSLRFVAAGTLLNLNRVEDPRLAPLYARVDELRGGVNAREAAIVRLDTELRGYDRSAVQKGLLLVGGSFATVILLAIVLIVVIAR
jgi:hypothetical protein